MQTVGDGLQVSLAGCVISFDGSCSLKRITVIRDHEILGVSTLEPAGSEDSLSPIIELNHLVKRYRGVEALRGITLTIGEGITGLLGPNGSGKSTLIKSLLGLVRASEGSGRVVGQQWPEAVREIRELVGYLPEDDCYIAGLSGIESVAMMANLSGLPKIEGLRRAHEICDFCDFGEERYREVEGYSTGMRQKLKFAQALVHDPPLLILDEPTTGLDPSQRHAMLRRIKTLHTEYGKSVLLSTHILPDVKAICDAVIIMVDGTVKVMDTLENLSEPIHPTQHVMTLGDPHRLISRIKEGGFDVNLEIDGMLRISPMKSEQVNLIWRWAAETNTMIRRVVPAMNSLDQIFVDAATSSEVK